MSYLVQEYLLLHVDLNRSSLKKISKALQMNGNCDSYSKSCYYIDNAYDTGAEVATRRNDNAIQQGLQLLDTVKKLHEWFRQSY